MAQDTNLSPYVAHTIGTASLRGRVGMDSPSPSFKPYVQISSIRLYGLVHFFGQKNSVF